MKNSVNFTKIRISNLKKTINYFGLVFIALTFSGCSSIENSKSKLGESIENINYYNRWNFDSLNGWVDGSQNMNELINYTINNGVLNIYTRANTWDRPKVRTPKKIYKKGKYSWRVFVPEMGIGDMASIGAFLYNDDTHELDFEIGYGTTEVRQNLKASKDDLVVYMTSQANPFQSIPQKIKRKQWYTLGIELKIINEKYQVTWSIDNAELIKLDLNYGENHPFYIFCSVENLTFLGDHIPGQDNYALFDYVEIIE